MCKITVPLTQPLTPARGKASKAKIPVLDQFQYSISGDEHFDDLSESESILSCGSFELEDLSDSPAFRRLRAKSLDDATGTMVESHSNLSAKEEVTEKKRSISPRNQRRQALRRSPMRRHTTESTPTKGNPSFNRAGRSLSPSSQKSTSSAPEQPTLQRAATLDGATLGSRLSSGPRPRPQLLQRAATLDDSKLKKAIGGSHTIEPDITSLDDPELKKAIVSSHSVEHGSGPARRLTKGKSVIQHKQIKHGLALQDESRQRRKKNDHKPSRRPHERPSQHLHPQKQRSHRSKTRGRSPQATKSRDRDSSNALVLAEQNVKVAALTKLVTQLQEELVSVHQELDALKAEKTKAKRSNSVHSISSSSSHGTAFQMAMPTLVGMKEFSKRPFTWGYTNKKNNDDSMVCLEGAE